MDNTIKKLLVKYVGIYVTSLLGATFVLHLLNVKIGALSYIITMTCINYFYAMFERQYHKQPDKEETKKIIITAFISHIIISIAGTIFIVKDIKLMGLIIIIDIIFTCLAIFFGIMIGKKHIEKMLKAASAEPKP